MVSPAEDGSRISWLHFHLSGRKWRCVSLTTHELLIQTQHLLPLSVLHIKYVQLVKQGMALIIRQSQECSVTVHHKYNCKTNLEHFQHCFVVDQF